MQLFYAAHAQAPAFEFDPAESKHLVRVLRKRTGDRLWVTNGSGVRYLCEISNAADKRVELQVLEQHQVKPRAASLTLAVAPTKNMDRMEWLVEKATEIGVERIVPMLCEHSERKVIKAERLQRIAVAAMKQSLRDHLPEIEPLMKFEALIRSANPAEKYIAHLPEAGDAVDLNAALNPGHSTIIMIGPEGDFSSSEVQAAKEQGFKMVGLGLSRLRTETAALAAVHTFALHNPTAT